MSVGATAAGPRVAPLSPPGSHRRPWSLARRRAGSWASVWARVLDYVELAKPRIALLSLATVAVGAVLASGRVPDGMLLAHTLVGTALVAAGASALNQLLERDTDRKMVRTLDRPLPAGRLTAAEAGSYGAILSLAGLAHLAWFTNLVAAGVALATLVGYVAVYTPLKRKTSLNTLVGAIPGALPPVIGWAAVRGELGPEAWVLFLIVFLWQFPHFLAIAWIHRTDYARAGLKMLSVADARGSITGRQMVGYALALVPVSLLPSAIGLSGAGYFWGALGSGAVFAGLAAGFLARASAANARRVLWGSLVYLPTVMGLLVLDWVRW